MAEEGKEPPRADPPADLTRGVLFSRKGDIVAEVVNRTPFKLGSHSWAVEAVPNVLPDKILSLRLSIEVNGERRKALDLSSQLKAEVRELLVVIENLKKTELGPLEAKAEENPEDADVSAELMRVLGVIGQHRRRIQMIESGGPFPISFDLGSAQYEFHLTPGQFATVPPFIFENRPPTDVEPVTLCWCITPSVPISIVYNKSNLTTIDKSVSLVPWSMPVFSVVGSALSVSADGRSIQRVNNAHSHSQSHAIAGNDPLHGISSLKVKVNSHNWFGLGVVNFLEPPLGGSNGMYPYPGRYCFASAKQRWMGGVATHTADNPDFTQPGDICLLLFNSVTRDLQLRVQRTKTTHKLTIPAEVPGPFYWGVEMYELGNVLTLLDVEFYDDLTFQSEDGGSGLDVAASSSPVVVSAPSSPAPNPP